MNQEPVRKNEIPYTKKKINIDSYRERKKNENELNEKPNTKKCT